MDNVRAGTTIRPPHIWKNRYKFMYGFDLEKVQDMVNQFSETHDLQSHYFFTDAHIFEAFPLLFGGGCGHFGCGPAHAVERLV